MAFQLWIWKSEFKGCWLKTKQNKIKANCLPLQANLTHKNFSEEKKHEQAWALFLIEVTTDDTAFGKLLDLYQKLYSSSLPA